MTIHELQELIASEIFTPQGSRLIDEANDFPDFDATAEGVDAEAVQGIVTAILKDQGYWAIRHASPPPNVAIYGLQHPDNDVTYIRIRWRPPDENNPIGVFNPYTDLDAFAIPTAEPAYLRGITPGVPATDK